MGLKQLRLQHGYTCKQMADMLNISESTYRRYEKNPWPIRANKLLLLLDIFDVTSYDILGDYGKIKR